MAVRRHIMSFGIGAFLIGMILHASASSAQPSTDIYVGRLDIHTDSMTVSGLVNATHRAGYDNQPCFSGDGSWFFFSSADTSGETDVFRCEVGKWGISQITDTPESEYSPTILPDRSGFSGVRVEMDGTQRLWRFDMDGGNPGLVLAGIDSVGYHAWADENLVALFIVGEPHTLWLADVRTGTAVPVARNIDRALHAIPGTKLISFVEQGPSDRWSFQRLSVTDLVVTPSVPLLDGSRDCAWLNDGRIVMAADGILYVIDPTAAKARWQRVFSLESLGLRSITRLAVDSRSQRIAIVAEDEPSDKE